MSVQNCGIANGGCICDRCDIQGNLRAEFSGMPMRKQVIEGFTEIGDDLQPEFMDAIAKHALTRVIARYGDAVQTFGLAFWWDNESKELKVLHAMNMDGPHESLKQGLNEIEAVEEHESNHTALPLDALRGFIDEMKLLSNSEEKYGYVQHWIERGESILNTDGQGELADEIEGV